MAQTSAIIVAAGSSRRMGFDKLAAELAGRPVLQWTIDAFLNAASISEILVVCPPDRWEMFRGQEFSKPVHRIDGGTDRQDSVMAGLAAVSASTTFVVVHDGARPLILPSDIDRSVDVARKHQAVAVARRVTETLKRSDNENFSTEPVTRDNLWFMETPQVFEVSLLRRAYDAVIEQKIHVTDEVSALQLIDVPTYFLETGQPNLKITTPADLALAEALVR